MNNDKTTDYLIEQNQQLSAEVTLLTARCEQYHQAYEYLQEQILNLRRQMFGKKSERFIDPENKQQSLFDANELFANADLEQAENIVTQVTTHTRKNKSKTSNDDLPRRIEIIPLNEHDKQCACGACKNIICYETKELIHYVPSVLEILEQRREVAACPKGCDSSIVTAPAPLQILPKTKATAEFLSFF